MALKLTLEGTSPGAGLLTIQGANIAPGSIQLAIQRNQDEQYLAGPSQWQATPFWHTVSDVNGSGDSLQANLGPAIIDGLISASGMMFFVTLKTNDYQGQQVLKISGRLLGSEAAGQIASENNVAAAPVEIKIPEPAPEPPPPPPVVAADPIPEPEPIPEPVEEEPVSFASERPEPIINETEEFEEDEDEIEPEEEQKKPGFLKRFWYVWLFLVLLIALLAGVYLWWNTPWEGSDPNTPNPTPENSGQANTDGLRGRARASAYLDQQPKPNADQIVAEAKSWESDKDCEGVNILLNMAASTSSQAALSLAQLYDTQVEPNRPCSQDDLETAAYWYEMPANEGNTDAQLRLGQILTQQNSSGPLYDKGVQYLQKAAQNGNQAATEQLKALGE